MIFDVGRVVKARDRYLQLQKPLHFFLFPEVCLKVPHRRKLPMANLLPRKLAFPISVNYHSHTTRNSRIILVMNSVILNALSFALTGHF
jgi:hypothetical protein